MKTNEAIALIKQGDSAENVVLTDLDQTQLGFRDALLLTESGFVIPAGNIIYQDEAIEYDPDFDEVQWEGDFKNLKEVLQSKGVTSPSNLDRKEDSITIEISVADEKIGQWLDQNTPKLKEIVNKLVIDLYHTDQILHSK
jgi:hypothetical protein